MMIGCMLSPFAWEKVRMSTHTTSTQHYTGGPIQFNKGKECIYMACQLKERNKIVFFIDNMIHLCSKTLKNLFLKDIKLVSSARSQNMRSIYEN